MTDAGNYRAKRAWLTAEWIQVRKTEPEKIRTGGRRVFICTKEGKRRNKSAQVEEPIFEWFIYISRPRSFICLASQLLLGFLHSHSLKPSKFTPEVLDLPVLRFTTSELCDYALPRLEPLMYIHTSMSLDRVR